MENLGGFEVYVGRYQLKFVLCCGMCCYQIKVVRFLSVSLLYWISQLEIVSSCIRNTIDMTIKLLQTITLVAWGSC